MLSLKKPESVAVVIETAYQNVGLATSIAVGTFDDDATASVALGVPLFYGVLEAALIALWCLGAHYLGLSYAPPGVSLWKAIIGNFQPVTPDRAGDVGSAVDELDITGLTTDQTRERTSSAASSTASSPRQPYSPPALRSSTVADTPTTVALTSPAKEAFDKKYRHTPPSDSGGTPPTTPTKDSTGTDAGLFVTVPEDTDGPAQQWVDAGDDVPEVVSPHRIESPKPSPLSPSEPRPVELPSPRSA